MFPGPPSEEYEFLVKHLTRMKLLGEEHTYSSEYNRCLERKEAMDRCLARREEARRLSSSTRSTA